MLDPIAAVTHPDPYPFYADLVRERPIYRDEVADRVDHFVRGLAPAAPPDGCSRLGSTCAASPRT